MKTRLIRIVASSILTLVAGAIGYAHPHTNSISGYTQVNLVSDLPGAFFTDTNLANPWGIVAGPEAVWVNDNGPGLITAYSPNGSPFSFAVAIPGPGGTNAGTPSGLIFDTTHQFAVTTGSNTAPSTFLAATEDGTLAAWSRAISGSNATLVVDNSSSNAVYKGLAVARDTHGVPHLYAANFHAGAVDEFDTNYNYIQSFTDTNLPPLFAPFNVRTFRGKLFVTFAKQKLPDMRDDDAGPGNGYVDIFDTDGTLLRNFASAGVLNSPWGMAIAPRNFGAFSGTLLVGNFGDGKINAFDLLTGIALGNLTAPDGTDIVISGLWGLAFEREEILDEECGFVAQRLYFTAGLNDEADGLMGYIRASQPGEIGHGHGQDNGNGPGNGHGHGQGHGHH